MWWSGSKPFTVVARRHGSTIVSAGELSRSVPDIYLCGLLLPFNGVRVDVLFWIWHFQPMMFSRSYCLLYCMWVVSNFASVFQETKRGQLIYCSCQNGAMELCLL